MQQDNNHIDKKLRQLENQALPDLSQMDEHWTNMQGMLRPEATVPKPRNGNPLGSFRWLIAAAFLAGVSFLAYRLINSELGKTTHETGNISSSNATTPSTLPGDTILLRAKMSNGKDTILKAMLIAPKNTESKPGSISLHAKTTSGKDTVLKATIIAPKKPVSGPPQIDFPTTSASVSDKMLTTSTTDKRTAAATLAAFFKELEQQPQQFVIDTRSDTIIAGFNGTALLIPANSFTNSGHVTITLKEYYTYEDIISNKLTTCSDNEQLVTGGMIHIVATVDGKAVDIQPGKSIRWFVPDTSAAIGQMQLFSGVELGALGMPFTMQASRGTDTISFNTITNLETINWVPQNRSFTNTWLETRVKVLDLADEPYRKKQTGKGEIGFFTISDKPKISRDELVTELREKYGYYKVKIRKRRQTFFSKLTPSFLRKTYKLTNEVGDSVWVTADFARQYRLQATDTVTATRTGFRYVDGDYVKKSFGDINLNALGNRFSVDIRSLGWINCDKFYNDKQPKLNYYVDIKDSAHNYYTILVFDEMKSMMRGAVSGNRVIFYNVPKGISAKVICVGVQEGKTIAAMGSLPEYGTLLNNLKFEETTPAQFKEGIASMDDK